MSAEDTPPNVTGASTGTRLEVAVKEVIRAVKLMQDRDRVNVILFHTTVAPWQDALQRLTAANRKNLERHLESQKPMGGTNLYDALELALLEEEVDTIFLLSDGAPGLGRYVATDDILRAVRRLNQIRRIAIHCISVGRESDLMQRLAEENGGRYVRR
jgi:Mg-chelatase subunit ChlD